MSNGSTSSPNHSLLNGAARSAAQQSSQVSTTTLLNALHTIYTSGQTYRLDASTSLAVSTWLTAANSSSGQSGVALDAEIGRTAWEHARRRAEDGCIVLGYEPLRSLTLYLIMLMTPLALSIRRPRHCCPHFLHPSHFQHHRLLSLLSRHCDPS
jgi:chitin synthase